MHNLKLVNLDLFLLEPRCAPPGGQSSECDLSGEPKTCVPCVASYGFEVLLRDMREPRTALHVRMLEITQMRLPHGYRKIRVLSNWEGWEVGKKRVYRLYGEEGLVLSACSAKTAVRSGMEPCLTFRLAQVARQRACFTASAVVSIAKLRMRERGVSASCSRVFQHWSTPDQQICRSRALIKSDLVHASK